MTRAVTAGRSPAAAASPALFAATCVLVLLMSNNVIVASPGGATLYLGELLTWMIFIPGFALPILLLRNDPLSDGLRCAPEFALYLGVIILVALIAMGLEGTNATAGKVKNILPAFLLICLIVFTNRTDRRLQTLIWCVIGAAVVNAMVGLAQTVFGGPYIVAESDNNVWKEGLSGDLLERTANGLFETPNSLGVALISGLVLGSRLVLSRGGLPGLVPRLAGGFSCLAIAAGLVATANRGALIWAVLGILLALSPGRRKGWLCLFAFISTNLIMVLAALYSIETHGTALDTLVVRLRLWHASAVTFLQHPAILLIGNGEEALRYNAATLAGWALPSAHNTWIDQIVFFGLAGLAGYLAILSAAFARVLRARELALTSRHVAIADGLIGSLVAMAGVFVLEPRADGFFAVAQLAALCALAIVLARRVGEADAQMAPNESRIW